MTTGRKISCQKTFSKSKKTRSQILAEEALADYAAGRTKTIDQLDKKYGLK